MPSEEALDTLLIMRSHRKNPVGFRRVRGKGTNDYHSLMIRAFRPNEAGYPGLNYEGLQVWNWNPHDWKHKVCEDELGWNPQRGE